jgi:hypothetical protein
MTTRDPRATILRATASPMPELPPNTTTTSSEAATAILPPTVPFF